MTCRDKSFFTKKKENFRNIADVSFLFFPGICPGLHNPASVFLGQKQQIPVRQVDKSLCLPIHPPLFGHICEQKFCGDAPKHQCWAGKQFHTTLDPSKQEYSG